MASVVISGDTSGSVTLSAPAVAGTTTLTLPSTSGVVASIASVTNNGVVYANSSGQPTTGTAFVFDGTNVGIGTSSPTEKCHIYASSGNSFYRFQNAATGSGASDGGFVGIGGSGDVYLYNYETSNTIFATNNAEKMRIDSSGNLLVGQTSLLGNGGGGTLNATASSTTGNHFLATSNASFADSLLVLKTTAKAASSTFNWCYFLDSSSVAQFKVSGNGVIYAQNTSVQSISDVRLKENIKNSDDGLDVITALRPVRYDWKEGYGNDRKNQLGFIAQEVESVFPDAVNEWQGINGTDDTVYKTVGPAALIPVLVKAIQEQQALIQQLQADMEILKGKA